MSRSLTSALLVLGLTQSAEAQDIQGVVRDPQGAPVAGATVKIACAAFGTLAVTSSDGAFAAKLPAPRRTCTSEVRRPGFAPWHRQLREGRTQEIQLQLARREEAVTVVAGRETEDSRIAAPLGSITMVADDFAALGPDANRWIETARLAAGAFTGQTRLYVDGLPAADAPSAVAISRISINADPFSAEHGGVDENRVEIALNEPERVWHFSASGLSVGPAGRETLANGEESRAYRRAFSVSGPLPHLPLVAFLQAGGYGETRQLAYRAAGDEGVRLEDSAEAATRIASLATGLNWTGPGFSLSGAMRQSQTTLMNAGVGGVIAPAAAASAASQHRSFETSWRAASDTVTHRGGLQFVRTSLATHANSAARATVVAGEVVDGGDEVQAETRERSSVFFKHVVERRAAQPWMAGVELTNNLVRATRSFNPLGVIQLDSPGAQVGSWMARQGAPDVAVTTSTAAAFVDFQPWRDRHSVVRAGVRGEWQRGAGVFLSPRIAGQLSLRGFVAGLGAGLFVAPWSPELLSEAALRDRRQTSTLFVPGAVIDEPASLSASGAELLEMTTVPGLERRRDAVVRLSLRRQAGPASFGVEETWTHGSALAGLSRLRDSRGLVDVLASDRRLRRGQTHVTAGLKLARLSLGAHYEMLRSSDDTEGAFSLPGTPQGRTGEWGPSSGIARHNFSLVSSATLPAAIRASVVATAASGLPYSPITGRDPAGLFTYIDRAGLPRNSQSGPPSRNLSVYLSRHVALPHARGAALDLGVRAENLLNRTNVEQVMTLQGPWLGRALRASPGRAVRVWMSVAK